MTSASTSVRAMSLSVSPSLHPDLHRAGALTGVVRAAGLIRPSSLLAAEHDADDEAGEHDAGTAGAPAGGACGGRGRVRRS